MLPRTRALRSPAPPAPEKRLAPWLPADPPVGGSRFRWDPVVSMSAPVYRPPLFVFRARVDEIGRPQHYSECQPAIGRPEREAIQNEEFIVRHEHADASGRRGPVRGRYHAG